MPVRASTVFKGLVSGPNFMTQEPFGYGFIGDEWVYELSEGIGLVGEAIFGVSVLSRKTGRPNHEMGSMVSSKQAAYELVDILREGESK